MEGEQDRFEFLYDEEHPEKLRAMATRTHTAGELGVLQLRRVQVEPRS